MKPQLVTTRMEIRGVETHWWLFCRECAETGATCDRHAQQAKED